MVRAAEIKKLRLKWSRSFEQFLQVVETYHQKTGGPAPVRGFMFGLNFRHSV
jgi:hypothetical protein